MAPYPRTEQEKIRAGEYNPPPSADPVRTHACPPLGSRDTTPSTGHCSRCYSISMLQRPIIFGPRTADRAERTRGRDPPPATRQPPRRHGGKRPATPNRSSGPRHRSGWPYAVQPLLDAPLTASPSRQPRTKIYRECLLCPRFRNKTSPRSRTPRSASGAAFTVPSGGPRSTTASLDGKATAIASSAGVVGTYRPKRHVGSPPQRGRTRRSLPLQPRSASPHLGSGSSSPAPPPQPDRPSRALPAPETVNRSPAELPKRRPPEDASARDSRPGRTVDGATQVRHPVDNT